MTELRLKELAVENFRSISGRCVIPLDGSITLVHGANGAGKTSLLSAIELAATGRVGFLEEQVADTRLLLRNHDFQVGSVRLSLTENDEGDRVGSFELNGDRVTGTAALTPAEQTYFIERSFLPQTALGRLLESYTDTGRHVDTALVRFVKSLVGLNDLDALIDGLRAAGDRRRSKKLIPSWGRRLDELDAANARLAEASSQLKSARQRLDASANLLRELANAPDLLDPNELLRLSADRGRSYEGSRAEFAHLEELQGNVDAIIRMKQRANSKITGRIDSSESIRATAAEAALKKWASQVGEAALIDLNRVRVSFLDQAPVTLGRLADAYNESLERAMNADRIRAEALAVKLERESRVSSLDQQVHKLDKEIAVAEANAQKIGVSDDVRLLIQILEMTIPVVNSERCPVCDESFTGAGRLSDHLAEKLGRLSSNSNQLLAIERQLKKLREDRLASVRELVFQKSTPVPNVGEPMDDAIRSLNGLGDIVRQGNHLREEFQAAEGGIAEMTAQAATREIIEGRLKDVAGALGLSRDDLSVDEPEVSLARELSTRMQLVRASDARRDRERNARQAVEDAQRDVSRWGRELKVAGEVALSLQTQVTTAESRMAKSRQVLQTAERVRSKLINQVFDQSLNSLWAQLFGRFAPTERFTPRFVKQTESTRSVDVRLETELPGGHVSGSPGAMLSYGNANSAALALFMALHLSAPSDLPWLILDDPVQSMDDIHVANFAAIIRQLAFVHQRQVVIAIHQPELFDYLSLALAPSETGQTLVRVTLDRGAGATTAHIERVEHVEEPVLYSAK